MAKGSNASPEMFGFDFQVNATIFLLLENIKTIKKIRMEGASEDIELTMKDGNKIMAQAKATVKGDSDFSHSRSKLTDAIQAESHINCFAPEGLTHILRVNDGDNSILNVKKTYRRLIKEPLDAELIRTIKDWLDEKRPSLSYRKK